MSFATAIKDYIDLLNNVYDSVSGNVTFQLLISQTFIYIFGSIKYIAYYFLTFQWFRDLCYLPILVPQISTSILKETFFLETPLTSFFTLLDTPIYINNKFLIGFLNSFFLSLPISATHLIWARRLLIQGIPAGIAAGLGNIIGQTWFLFCILLGLRLFIIPWFSLEPLNYVIGIVFILTVVYDMVHQRSIKIIKFSDKITLIKIFFINFILSWTEQTVFYQYFGNLTFSSEPTILEISSANSELEFILIHGSYLLGILIGSIVFTTFFGWFFLRFSNFLLGLSTVPYSRWINQLNVVLLTTIVASTFTSIPFYGLDYLLAGSLGFVSQDKAFEKTFLAPTTIGDPNKMLGDNSSYKSLDTDISSFDRGQYLGLDSNSSFEELNYQGEYAWTARQDRRAAYRNDKFKKLISNFFKKTNQDATTLQTDVSRMSEKNPSFDQRFVNKRGVNEPISSSKPNIQEKNELDSSRSKSIRPSDDLNKKKSLNLDSIGSEKNYLLRKSIDNSSLEDDLYDSDDIDETSNSGRPNLSFFRLNERVHEDAQPAEILEPFFNGSFSDKFFDDFSKTINPVLEKKMKQRYYSNPVYKLLLKVDIDSFIARQPTTHSLTQEEEKQLFEKRLVLANYYDSLRYYNQLPYAEDFQNFFNGSKSYADRIYNHQFKGTLKIIRRLFSITLNAEQNPQEKRILKFDQPLYKNNMLGQNSLQRDVLSSALYHEELRLKKTKKSPFIQLVNPIPFYTGWDEKLRKLVITNRLLPRNLAGFSIKNPLVYSGQGDNNLKDSSFKSDLSSNTNSHQLDSKPSFDSLNPENMKFHKSTKKVDFTSWPIPKIVLEKSKSKSKIPYNVMFESLDDPSNAIIAEQLQDIEDINWQFNTVPPNMKKFNVDQIKDVVPPARGGFIWPGQSYLKFNITSLIKK